MSLTDRRRQILGFIADYQTRRGHAPSFKEIGFAVGLTSTSTVAQQIRALTRAGLVEQEPHQPRTIRLAPAVTVSPDGFVSQLVPVGECWRCETQHPADFTCTPVQGAAPVGALCATTSHHVSGDQP